MFARLRNCTNILVCTLLMLAGVTYAGPVDRPTQPEGPAHSGQLISLNPSSDSAQDNAALAPPRILIVTSGFGPLTGISPIAEKDYFNALLSGGYQIDWLDVASGYLTLSHMSGYDLVIYDAGGYWYPFTANTSALSAYHNSGKPLLLVAPDINYDWRINGLGTFPQDVLHIDGVLGIMPEASFQVIANTGHQIIQSIPTNLSLPVVNQSSWPDCFDPSSDAVGVLTQGFISETEFGMGTSASLPSYSSYDPHGSLYGATAYSGNQSQGRVALYGFPVTALQSSVLDELMRSTVRWLLGTATVGFTLVCEDAPDGVVVNKGKGDIVDFVAKLKNDNENALSNLTVEISVPGDQLGNVTRAYRRDDESGGDGEELTSTEPAAGRYQVTIPNLAAHASLQVGWRFTIPSAIASICLSPTGNVTYSGYVAGNDQAELNITTAAQGIIITNRKLLYDKFATTADDKKAVTSMLNYVYEISDGNGTNEISNVVYYLDRENTTVRDWDQYAVDLTSATSVNACATQVQDMVQKRCTRYSPQPTYLTILGGDEVVPLYRLSDADYANVEQFATYPGTQDPLLLAVNDNFFFSDAPYSDLNGNDWNVGDVELASGRVSGASAADMHALMRNCIARPSAATTRAIIASRDGFDSDVAMNRLVDRTFDVRNDTETPVTFETETWTATDLVSLLSGGFRIAFPAGHSNYDRIAGMLATQLPDVNSSGGFIFGGGCRTAIPSDAGASWQPVSTDNNTWSAVHQGARGFFGSLGLVSGSLAYGVCTYGELFSNDFMTSLIPTTGSVSSTASGALRSASRAFDPADAGERKAACQFIYYGLPWMSIDIPQTSSGMIFAAFHTSAPAHYMVVGPTSKSPNGSYAVDFRFVAPGHTVEQTDGFDLLKVPGADLRGLNLKPLLPMFKNSVLLPPDAVVLSVEIQNEHSVSVGSLNIPSPTSCELPPCPPPFSSAFDVTGIYPSSRLAWNRDSASTASAVNLRLYPATFNIDTKETILYDTTVVRITFASNAPILINSFKTQGYWDAGQAHIRADVKIKNVSELTVSALTAHMEVFDQSGNPVGDVTAPNLSVSAQGEIETPLTLSGNLNNARYLVTVSVLDAGGTPLAQVSDFIWLSAGEQLNFLCPDGVLIGQDIMFSSDFRNNGVVPMDVHLVVKIYGDQGVEFASLPGQPVTVQAGALGNLSVQWNTLGKPIGIYTAVGSVQTANEQYGPISRNFAISPSQQLQITPNLQLPIARLPVQIHLGNLPTSMTVADIASTSVKINGTLSPRSQTILSSYPGFVGQVLELNTFGMVFRNSFPTPTSDTASCEYTVSGRFADNTPFTATGQVKFLPFIQGDVDGDGAVSLQDLAILGTYLRQGSPVPTSMENADVNGDGIVNLTDFSTLMKMLSRSEGQKPTD